MNGRPGKLLDLRAARRLVIGPVEASRHNQDRQPDGQGVANEIASSKDFERRLRQPVKQRNHAGHSIRH